MAVVALDDKQNLVLTRQYWYLYNRELIESPTGSLALDGLTATKRELQEKTGYVSDKWAYLGKTIESSSKLTNYLHLCFANNCKKAGDQQLDSTEEIEIILVSFENAAKMVMDNEIFCNNFAHGVLQVTRMLGV